MYIRRGPSGGDGESLRGSPGGEFGQRWPAVWEYISADQWEDGVLRQTSTLQIFVDRGSVKVAMKDREAGKICFCAGRDVQEALDALESALRGGTAEWREDSWKKRK